MWDGGENLIGGCRRAFLALLRDYAQGSSCIRNEQNKRMQKSRMDRIWPGFIRLLWSRSCRRKMPETGRGPATYLAARYHSRPTLESILFLLVPWSLPTAGLNAAAPHLGLLLRWVSAGCPVRFLAFWMLSIVQRSRMLLRHAQDAHHLALVHAGKFDDLHVPASASFLLHLAPRQGFERQNGRRSHPYWRRHTQSLTHSRPRAVPRSETKQNLKMSPDMSGQ